ncbi:MAG: sigma-54 dependent transcriptional regulator, partial [Gammaproteobacteria bacterium]|nr:sigma-54 dependent transcriptional regulator [Gammaproteobacteria bacterium]
MSAGYILVVDDEPDIRGLVKEILEDESYEVSTADSAQAARAARRARRPDLILLDIWMPDTDGISLLKEWADNSGQDTPVIMMSGHGTVETAVEATRLGAYDFLEKPLSTAKLLLTVKHALETAHLKQENIGLKRDSDAVTEPIGRSPVMQNLREQIKRIAQHDTSVLLLGESGSGKEVCARYLHQMSNRRAGPFVRVPITGLTSTNSAAELFGAEEGDQVHFGSLEQANGGTLFMEDLVEMDIGVQARLLSALKHQSFIRVDGVAPVRINARFIGATSHDPARAVHSGKLREDLYYHLNVVPLEVPALREHREDIPELLTYYIDQLVSKEGLPYRRFTFAAQNRLRNYAWPGNIRELKNLVHRLLILGNGAEIDQEEIEQAIGQEQPVTGTSVPARFDLPLKEAREEFERSYLEFQLRQHGGNVSQVAARVGIERTHLYRKMRALGID